MEHISYEDFSKVHLNVWTIIDVKDFPTARKPAYQVWIDFWGKIWIKKSSAQITDLYTKEELLWKQIVAVTNFAPKQIWNFMSECLITWFSNSAWEIVLIHPGDTVPNWERLH